MCKNEHHQTCDYTRYTMLDPTRIGSRAATSAKLHSSTSLVFGVFTGRCRRWPRCTPRLVYGLDDDVNRHLRLRRVWRLGARDEKKEVSGDETARVWCCLGRRLSEERAHSRVSYNNFYFFHLPSLTATN